MSAKSKSINNSTNSGNNSATGGNNSATGGNNEISTGKNKKKTSNKTENIESVVISNQDLDAEFGDTWDEQVVENTVELTDSVNIDSVNIDSVNVDNECTDSDAIGTKVDQKDTIDSDESFTASEEIAVTENQQRIAEGNVLLEKLIKDGYEVNGIDGSMIIRNWEDISLATDLNKYHVRTVIAAVRGHGLEIPRSIQATSILRILRGGDFIGQASAGSGKTVAFGLPAILSTDPTKISIQKIIVVPTTLLAQQIIDVINELSRGTGIKIQNWSGGEKYCRDRRPHIVVGTPGRICDVLTPKVCKDGIERSLIDLRHLTSLIFDEGDELLKQGFKDQLSTIVKSCPETTQVCIFSATFPATVLNICNGFMHNPAQLIVPEKKVITTRVNQYYSKCKDETEKLKDVIDCITKHPIATIMIFCNTCTAIRKLSEALTNNTTPIRHLCLNGRMPSEDKKITIRDFISGKCRVLLSSDLGARGFDYHEVSIVINYDMPNCVETYVHRIGRAGRAGDIGNAVTLITSDQEMSTMKFIVQFHGMPIRETVNKKSKEGVIKVKFRFA